MTKTIELTESSRKPVLIAEVGSNFRDLDDCLFSIKTAADCGADICKFQVFDHVDLYGFSDHDKPHPMARIKDWLPQLKAKCDEHGIGLAVTAFSPELVAAVDPYVSVHKVASSDANCPQMLEAVAKTGKPTLVSLGAVTGRDFDQIQMRAQKNWILLECVAAYPADCMELDAIGSHNGLSDHTLGYTAAVEAARRGAIVIEKHFTAFPDLDTPDRPHSLNPTQFKRMVDIIRGREVESEEGAMHLRHRRRLIATQDISPGQSLRFGVNFGAYRSLEDDTRGASPWDWEKVNGRMAKGPISGGKGVSLEDVE